MNRRTLTWLLLVLVLVGCGAAGIYQFASGQRAAALRTAPVERGELLSTISATGTLNAVVTVQVGTQVSGTISRLSVDFNSPVKKGMLIARIDPASFEAKVNQARADLESARASVLNQQAALLVPNAAFRVRLGGSGDGTTPKAAAGRERGDRMTQQINLLQDGKPVTRRVCTGLSDGQRTEILEDLSGDETVIEGLTGPAANRVGVIPGPPGPRF